MKTKIIFILCMISSIIAFGQNQKTTEEITCTPPLFTGIKSTNPMQVEAKFPTIENYLIKNVIYPEVAKEQLRQGTEIVRFIVTTQGEIANIEIINSVSREIDYEVISTLLTTNGMWKPGHNNEKPMSMEKEVSILFKIDEMGCDIDKLGIKYYSHGAQMLFTKNNPKKALKYFDKGITLLPKEKSLLAIRGLTRFELGDKDGALKDWTRIKTLGGLEGNEYIESYMGMKGYAEMTRVLEK